LSRLIRETELLNTTQTASVLVLYNYELGRWVEACTTLPYAFMGALSVRSSFKRRRIDCGFAHDPVVEAHVPERIVSPPLAARELYESTANIDRVQLFEIHALPHLRAGSSMDIVDAARRHGQHPVDHDVRHARAHRLGCTADADITARP